MGKRILLLEDTDVITKGDWCRPLNLETMSGGMSDEMSFTSMYSGAPENNVKWCRVERIMPFWIGDTIGHYCTKMAEFTYYEFVRGKLPDHHIHHDAEAPDYNPADYVDVGE